MHSHTVHLSLGALLTWCTVCATQVLNATHHIYPRFQEAQGVAADTGDGSMYRIFHLSISYISRIIRISYHGRYSHVHESDKDATKSVLKKKLGEDWFELCQHKRSNVLQHGGGRRRANPADVVWRKAMGSFREGEEEEGEDGGDDEEEDGSADEDEGGPTEGLPFHDFVTKALGKCMKK